MGDTAGSLFKSMKAKLGMNNTKQKGNHHQDGLSTKPGGVSDVVDETDRQSVQKDGHRRDPRKSTLEKPSKSREMMLTAYKGTCRLKRLVHEITTTTTSTLHYQYRGTTY